MEIFAQMFLTYQIKLFTWRLDIYIYCVIFWIYIYIIGIGENVNLEELKVIASSPSHLYMEDSITPTHLSEAICNGNYVFILFSQLLADFVRIFLQ